MVLVQHYQDAALLPESPKGILCAVLSAELVLSCIGAASQRDRGITHLPSSIHISRQQKNMQDAIPCIILNIFSFSLFLVFDLDMVKILSIPFYNVGILTSLG